MSRLLGTDASLASDLLIVSEILISVLVLVGFLLIKRGRRVGPHRAVMLWTLGLNAFFLAGFLVQDAVKSQTVLSEGRGLRAPLSVFVPMLAVHLAIAASALGVAVASWLIARKGVIRTATGIDLRPEVRLRHRRVSRFYPYLWAATLLTGLLLYYVIYVLY